MGNCCSSKKRDEINEELTEQLQDGLPQVQKKQKKPAYVVEKKKEAKVEEEVKKEEMVSMDSDESLEDLI